MSALVSVIIPVYNVCDYLDRCVMSVVNQTYSNLEIILVDDGSYDGSSDRCDEWGEKDVRVRVIHKNHGGVSSARNAGMKNASGEYITFIDGDDWIGEHTFAEILKNGVHTDVVVYNYKRIFPDGTISLPQISTPVIENDYLHELHRDKGIKGFVCNKLYRKEIIGDVRFREDINICEDLLFNVEISRKRPGYKLEENIFYYYFQHSQSAVASKYMRDVSLLDYYIAEIDLLKDNEKLRLDQEKKYVRAVEKIYVNNLIDNNNIIIKRYRAMSRQYVKDMARKDPCHWNSVTTILVCYFYFIYDMIYYVYKIWGNHTRKK